VPLTLEQNPSRCLVRLQEGVDICAAAELKHLLLEALSTGKELRIDLEQATDIDVTALQLIWAAGRDAKNAGVAFSVGDVPEDVLTLLQAVGLEEFLTTASSL